MFACLVAQRVSQSIGPPSETTQALLDVAREFSPRVQSPAPDRVILDLTGLDRLLGAPADIARKIAARAAAAGLRAQVAVAANSDAAICAARAYPGVTVVRPGRESRLLGDLALELLDPPDDVLETWHLWGLHTFRDLAALSEAALAARLGAAGVELQRRARGVLERPLLPETAAPEYVRSMELEYPVSEAEPLLFVLSGMVSGLCAELEMRGMAADELHCRGKLLRTNTHQEDWERSLRLPCPMRDTKALLKLVQLDLEKHPPPAPVVAVTLRATPVPPQLLQRGLFQPAAPEPEKLEITLARIARLIGEDRLGSPELLDTHRRDAFRMVHFRLPADVDTRTILGTQAVFGTRKDTEEKPEGHGRLVLRRFRPPLPARVRGCPPDYVMAQGIQGRVEAAAGPWRSSGDWWNVQRWSRDEWDVAIANGGLLRIFQDLDTLIWYVDGCYD
jgi:protein ImuB